MRFRPSRSRPSWCLHHVWNYPWRQNCQFHICAYLQWAFNYPARGWNGSPWICSWHWIFPSTNGLLFSAIIVTTDIRFIRTANLQVTDWSAHPARIWQRIAIFSSLSWRQRAESWHYRNHSTNGSYRLGVNKIQLGWTPCPSSVVTLGPNPGISVVCTTAG